MTEIVIGFSAPKSWMIGAEMIKFWMRTPYCHVYLRVYSNYTGQSLIYQASHGMVHCLTAANFFTANTAVAEFTVPISEDNLRNTLRFAQQLLGQPYGYLGLIKLVLRKWFKGVKGDGNKSFHCSEFIAKLFPQFIENCPQPDFIEPVHLYKVLESRYGAVK